MPALVVMLGGCTTVFGLDEPVHALHDADVIDTADIDASSPTCMDRWLAGTPMFDAPTLFAPASSTASESTPFGNELRVVWSSDRAGTDRLGGFDVWIAYRPNLTAAWIGPNVLAGVNSTSNETSLTATADELTVFFESDRTGGLGLTDVWTSTRVTGSTTTFTTPTQAGLGAINDAGPQHDPGISADGLELFLAPTLNGFVHATRATTADAFGTPSAIVELNAGTNERDPKPASDPRLLLFTSNRAGGPGGNGDLWFAIRPDRGAAFGTPVLVPNVNSASADADPGLSADGCTLYFVSQRVGGTTTEVFVATMTRD